MIAKDNGGGNFTPAPAGTHVAICIKLIDIGRQREEYQGQVTHPHQFIMGWELPNELIQGGELDGQPFYASKFYTLSLHEKATLRKDLASWRGRDFTPEELEGFDVQNVLGKACMLSIVSKKGGGTKIGGVMALPNGMQVPKQTNPSVYFSLDEFDKDVFDSLSDGIKKFIVQSPEYLALHKESNGATGVQDGPPLSSYDNFDDSQISF
jgi:hypothetical protein